MRFQMARHLGSLKPAQEQMRALLARGITEETRHGETGVKVPPEFDPQDYISFLLYIDAEIEHGLMVQYLYAAYSLGGPQVPEEYQTQVRQWQESILGIAKEEMAHLISVQNVLRLIGAPLNFGREDYPWDTPFYPFPFMLEPLTLDSLAKYVYAESPAPDQWPESLRHLQKEMMKRLPTGTGSLHRVGELFDHLIPLVKDPNFVPDEAFQAETWPFQAKWDEWGRGYQGEKRGLAGEADPVGTPNLLVVPVATRDDAVSALKEVAEQGEATTCATGAGPSHFDRFLKVFQEMLEICPDAGWSPVRNVATNPFIPPSNGEDEAQDTTVNQPRDPITNPEAVQWGHLFNVRYRMVLNYLVHSFELAGGLNQAGTRTPRGTIINATFGEMYNMRAISNIMVQIPLAEPGCGDKFAGPPFQMPYSLNLPSGEANRWRLHRNLLLACEPLIAELLEISPASRHTYLYALREADQALLQIIDHILAGHIHFALT